MGIWMLLGLIGMLLAGAVLAVWGIRGRRINRDPVCRDCGFNLGSMRLPEMHGIAEPARCGDEGEMPVVVTCPECGGGLKRAKAVRIGERKRMPLVAIAGFLTVLGFFVAAAPLMFAALSGTGVVNKLPLGILLLIAKGSDATVAGELESRLLKTKMGAVEVDAIVSRVVDLQGDWESEWSPKWGDVYEAATLLGPIRQDLADAWSRQSVELLVVPRPAANPEDPLPFHIQIGKTRINRSGSASIKADVGYVRVGGVECEIFSDPELFASPGYLVAKGPAARSGGPDQSLAAVRLPRSILPGEQVIEVGFQVKNAPGGTVRDNAARFQRAVSRTVVLPVSESSATPVVPTDRVRQLTRAIFDAKRVILQVDSWRTVGNGPKEPVRAALEVDTWPKQIPDLDFAFTAWLIDADGREHYVGDAYTAPWRSGGQAGRTFEIRGGLTNLANPPSGVVTLVLRPDVSVAKRSTAIRQYYGEEIKLEPRELQYRSYEGSIPASGFRTIDELVEAVNARK
ncbi:MAG: hypothetical protein KF805_05245 [Phycisphaeraceae bacterium]|nr:hypothetical protein [Phycisphaeraceae bacterium]